MGKAFERLQKQVETKEANGNTCTSNLSGKYDVEYFKEPEVTEYILDRSVEYTTVLASNEEVNIYGSELVQVNDEVQVTGLNETVVASVEGSTVKSYRYDDYGFSTDTTQGHGYNSEMKDETGLIYLRARYYDPSIGRFIQIDNNYAGEKEEVVTQNRYTYTLNNPYKYVDRDGNRTLEENGGFPPPKVTGSLARWLSVSDAIFEALCITYVVPASLKVKMKQSRDKYFRASYVPRYDIFDNWLESITNQVGRGYNKPSNGGNARVGLGEYPNKVPEYLKPGYVPPKPITNLQTDCSGIGTRKVSPTFKYDFELAGVDIDYGVFVLKIEKTIKTRYELSTSEASKIASVGLTSEMKWDLDFDMVISSFEELFENLGASVSLGDWLSIVVNFNTTVGFTEWAYIRWHGEFVE